MRDIEADERTAMVSEYKMYRNGGMEQAAAHVAAALKEQHGYDIEDAYPELDEFTADSPEGDPDMSAMDAPERADEPAAPENTAVPKPARAAKKTAAKPPAR